MPQGQAQLGDPDERHGPEEHLAPAPLGRPDRGHHQDDR